jgi:hypothetical protein
MARGKERLSMFVSGPDAAEKAVLSPSMRTYP